MGYGMGFVSSFSHAVPRTLPLHGAFEGTNVCSLKKRALKNYPGYIFILTLLKFWDTLNSKLKRFFLLDIK